MNKLVVTLVAIAVIAVAAGFLWVRSSGSGDQPSPTTPASAVDSGAPDSGAPDSGAPDAGSPGASSPGAGTPASGNPSSVSDSPQGLVPDGGPGRPVAAGSPSGASAPIPKNTRPSRQPPTPSSPLVQPTPDPKNAFFTSGREFEAGDAVVKFEPNGNVTLGETAGSWTREGDEVSVWLAASPDNPDPSKPAVVFGVMGEELKAK